MELGGAGKRGRPEGGLNANGHGGFKKSKQEMESFTTGIGSKLKPCTKFFSASGCSFGDGCHFLHYVPGGIKAVTQILGHNPSLSSAPRNTAPPPPPFSDGPAPFIKTRLCKRFQTAEGCKFGDGCNFAHGEWEIGKPAPFPPPHEDHTRGMGGHHMHGRFGGGGRMEPGPPSLGMTAGFGASATAKISINAAVAGAVIGKGGVNSKQICRVTGAKLSVRDHESDPNSRNIELEGTFDQIKHASQMVQELIANISAGQHARSGGMAGPGGGGGGGGGGGSSHFKTKLCEKFSRGSCTFGERCHFAHGEGELRNPE